MFKKSEEITKTWPGLGESAELDSYQFEEFDKIVQRKGYQIYNDMRYDEQIKFCLLIKKLLILSAGWQLEEAPGGREEKEFVEANFANLEKSFSSILLEFLSAFDYGFSCAELIWKKDKTQSKIFLKDIKFKFPWNVEFKYDKYGNLTELWINRKKVKLKKFVIYSFMSVFGNKAGESDLKASYAAWWFKDNIWKFWSRHLERFGSPIVKGHAPDSSTAEERNKFFRILNRLHHITTVLLPRTRKNEEFDFELVESKREGGDQFLKAMENANTRITRSFLLPQLFGASQTNFGSYALGGLQFKVVYKFLAFISRNFAEDVVQRQIIKTLLDYNFVNPKYPKFSFKPFEPELVQKVIEDAVNETKTEQAKLYRGSEAPNKCPTCGANIVYQGNDFFVCHNGHTYRRTKRK